METDLNTVHIFKTNIDKISADRALHIVLENHPDIQQWSIDYEDVDCVLRVVSENLTSDVIMMTVKGFGYACRELS
ncbi:hypothetical protein [Flavobacterium poyangense]|uniref:hypothetical protein n=1 Tax=Flavobacterium poyangense TaxID=2204302 RepID=UPI0014204C9C|nr:hypothetical protein [Flavobacterium sp. JXAS1]